MRAVYAPSIHAQMDQYIRRAAVEGSAIDSFVLTRREYDLYLSELNLLDRLLGRATKHRGIQLEVI